MKKILSRVLILVAPLGAATFVYRNEIALLLAFNQLKPARPFSAASTPASPDYSRRESCAALPDRQDSADALPVIGVMDQQKSAANDAAMSSAHSNISYTISARTPFHPRVGEGDPRDAVRVAQFLAQRGMSGQTYGTVAVTYDCTRSWPATCRRNSSSFGIDSVASMGMASSIQRMRSPSAPHLEMR
jgi:hypothetical protein